VSWYGVAASHELDRRRWTADERDFEICVLSPYCGLVENAVKTFDVSEETGYAELQLRRVFRVPDHRQTRLWICEKSRHSRFLPLLDRSQELCFQVRLHVDSCCLVQVFPGETNPRRLTLPSPGVSR